MTVQVRAFVPQNNTDILNAIRRTNSIDYQRRIPDATKANVQSVVQNMLNYSPTRNEFIDSLVNRIGMEIYKSTSWTNPLGKFKRGMLTFGDTIEEVNVGLLKAKVYNTDREYMEGDIFGTELPDVQSSFHKINRQNYYKLSIKTNLLRRAFNEEFGLSTFITDLMNTLQTSDQYDEFLLTTSLFSEYHKAGGFFKVNVADLGASSSVEADAKAFLRRTRELAGILQYPSVHYNASGMPIAAQPSELELFITPGANAAIDVEALAGAFNIEKANMPNRVTEIPAEYLNIVGAQAILTTRDFFVIVDSMIETASIQNPTNLETNYFLHHHQVVSASRFVPAILFTSAEASDVIVVTDTPVTDILTPTVVDGTGATVTSVVRGQSYQIVSNAITTPVGGDNDAVRFELTNAQSQRSYLVAQTGDFHVGVDENAHSLIFNVLAVDDSVPQLAKTLTIPVIGAKLELWPDPAVVPDVDLDGLLEVTPAAVPAAPTTGANKNKVEIPVTEGVDYKNGATVVSGTVITLTANATITAVAQAGYELAAGAVSSWALVFTA